MRVVFIFLSIFLLGSSVYSIPTEKPAPIYPPFHNKILKALWDVPTKEVKSITTRKYTKGNVHVEEVYYFSRPYKGQPVKIFGYFCFPTARKGKLPAILLSHGGGGTASLARSVSWAGRGYAVLAIDLPGKGENRRNSRSTGPNMDVSNLLQVKDLKQNYLVHAVAAARNGITYLTQRKEVDPQKIGMIGLSWGGVLTILTNGQDDRLKAAVNVFGAGYIRQECTWDEKFSKMTNKEKETWDIYIDPKNFLATQHAPIFFISGTNDHCYYLPTFQKSYAEVKVEKAYYQVPNIRHRFLSSSEIPSFAWLEQKLKDKGSFPKLNLLSPFKKQSSTEVKIVLPVEVYSKEKVKSVRLHYTPGGPQQWTEKKWEELSPFYEGGTYYFGLPGKTIQPEMLFYVSAKTQKAAVSSLVQSLFSVKNKEGLKTYAFSSPIFDTYQHQKPIMVIRDCGTAEESSDSFFYSKKDNAYRLFQVY